MKFRVTYSNGKTTEVESSDCESVESFCNSHFGSAWDEAKANGAMVEVVSDAQPKAPEPAKSLTVDPSTATEPPAEQDAREVQELPVLDTPPAAPVAPAKTVKKVKK